MITNAPEEFDYEQARKNVLASFWTNFKKVEEDFQTKVDIVLLRNIAEEFIYSYVHFAEKRVHAFYDCPDNDLKSDTITAAYSQAQAALGFAYLRLAGKMHFSTTSDTLMEQYYYRASAAECLDLGKNMAKKIFGMFMRSAVDACKKNYQTYIQSSPNINGFMDMMPKGSEMVSSSFRRENRQAAINLFLEKCADLAEKYKGHDIELINNIAEEFGRVYFYYMDKIATIEAGPQPLNEKSIKEIFALEDAMNTGLAFAYYRLKCKENFSISFDSQSHGLYHLAQEKDCMGLGLMPAEKIFGSLCSRAIKAAKEIYGNAQMVDEMIPMYRNVQSAIKTKGIKMRFGSAANLSAVDYAGPCML